MRERAIIIPILKIAAVLIFVIYLEKLAGTLSYLSVQLGSGEGRWVLHNALSMVLNLTGLAIAIVMWFFPVVVARKLRLLDEAALEFRVRYAWLEGSLLAVIGVYLAIDGLADLAYYLGLSLVFIEKSGSLIQVSPHTISGYAHSIVQLALALVLVGCARQIPVLLRRLRRM